MAAVCEWVQIAFCTQNHGFTRTGIPITEQGFQPIKPIVVEDDGWVGQGVMVMTGVRIGHGAVIGAGGVTKNVPPRAVMDGNPARVICYRKETTDNDHRNQRYICRVDLIQS